MKTQFVKGDFPGYMKLQVETERLEKEGHTIKFIQNFGDMSGFVILYDEKK